MALDPRIILMGQQPNLVNALQQGSQAAAQTNQVNDQNALRSLYAKQGAGIANGDQNALNALAGIDPQAALGVQESRLGMDQTRQSMDVQQQTAARLSREEQRIIEDRAAAMTKAERDATIAQIQTGLSELAPLYSRGDQAAYAAKLQELQLDPNEYGFQNFESKAAKFSEVLDVMKTFDERNAKPAGPEDPATIQALRIRAQEAGLQPGTKEYQAFMMNGGPAKKGMKVTLADGTEVSVGGVGGDELSSPNKTQAQKVALTSESIYNAIDSYKKIFDNGGAAFLPGKQRDALIAARRDLQLQMKELFNLGVLNGPDLELMDQLIVDTTDPTNYALDVLGVADIQERVDANTKQLKAQLKNLAGPQLKALGIDPDAPTSGQDGSGKPQPAPDFSAMSDEELDAYIQENSQ